MHKKWLELAIKAERCWVGTNMVCFRKRKLYYEFTVGSAKEWSKQDEDMSEK
jgi:hypothetical protein